MGKKCIKCKLIKEISDFNKYKASPDGLYSYCRVCIKKYRDTKKDKYKNTKTKYMKTYMKTYNKNSKYKEYKSLFYKDQKYIEYFKNYNQTPKYKYLSYKGNAKTKNVNFNLTFEEFISFWQRSCHYCGSLIETIGIDRVDNSKGYEFNNTVSCCKRCNYMKSNTNLQEFINHCKKIVEFNNL